MYYNDHNPPHVHARGAGEQMRIAIGPVAIIDGTLPAQQQRAVVDWVAAHRRELLDNWDRAQRHEVLHRIAP